VLSALSLRQTHLQGATYTATTVWPKKFDPQAAGARLVDERLASTEE
jgi:hypothetical protein